MKVLVVLAHPEPQSFNGSLFKVTVNELKSLGHEVKTSDLYAMKWKSQIDADDFPEIKKDERFRVAAASGQAYTAQKLTKDVLDEQAKLEWADLLILQFPLWWFSMPAILKGWVERVLSYGLGYGVGYSADKPHGERYGEGHFKGKRAMLSITMGGTPSLYSEYGVSGELSDILFPIHHGILFYPGFNVLPPYIAWGANRLTEEQFEEASKNLKDHLKNIEVVEPIPFRSQNGGDYDLKDLTLKKELVKPGVHGLKKHLK